MDYKKSLLREADYYGTDDGESIIIKWLKYKKDVRKGSKKDLDTYPKGFYEVIWPELIQQTCKRRETMTSILVTFEEYASFYGFKWKTAKAHGVNTFIAFFEEDNYSECKALEETELYFKLEKFVELASSCANMLPVPDFFNTGRSGPFAKWDYWDLTLIQIKKWFDSKCDEEKRDALRLLFAHSTHNQTYANRSTCMYDSIERTQKWLKQFNTWDDFLEEMCLTSFVNDKKCPILFWEGHSFELPLPTDIPDGIDNEESRNRINSNFNEFFDNINEMLKGRAKDLEVKERAKLYSRMID